MADLGRWTGGTTTLLPGTSWAAPASLFATQVRNDSSVYSFAAATSVLTLPSSGLADGYLIRANYELNDTSNGRCQPAGRFIQSGGTSNFISMQTTGYNRDNSEDMSYVQVAAIIDAPSAGATVQFQWMRDSDAPLGGTIASCIEIIPLYYSNIAMISGTTGETTGLVTPKTLSMGTTLVESDSAAIGVSANTLTVKGSNKRYLVIGGHYGDYATGRTMRVMDITKDGVADKDTRSYTYIRNTANGFCGAMSWDLVETATADIALTLGVSKGENFAGDMGAESTSFNTTPSAVQNGLVAIELNDSAEVFRSRDTTAGQRVSTIDTPFDVTAIGAMDFSDAASFTRFSSTVVNAEQAMDAFVAGNISIFDDDTTPSSARHTQKAFIGVNGTADTSTVAGDYHRGDQSTTGTNGAAMQPGGYVAVAANDAISMMTAELVGTESSSATIETKRASLFGINLDTMEDAGTLTYDITGALTIAVANTATLLYTNVTIDNPPLSGTSPVALASSATLEYAIGGIDHAPYAGTTPVVVDSSATVLYTNVAVNFTPLDGLSGITVGASATTAYTRNASFAGSSPVAVGSSAALEYAVGGIAHPPLAGSALVTVASSASATYNRNASVSGQTTATAGNSAALLYTNEPVHNTPYSGSFTVAVGNSAAFEYTNLPVDNEVSGTTPVAVGSAADMVYRLAGIVAIDGSSAVSVTSVADFEYFNFTFDFGPFDGSTPVAVGNSAAFEYTNLPVDNEVSGSTQVAVTASADMAYTNEPVNRIWSGQSPVVVTLAADMVYALSESNVLAGASTVTVGNSAAFEYTNLPVDHELSGTAPVAVGSTADMVYRLAGIVAIEGASSVAVTASADTSCGRVFSGGSALSAASTAVVLYTNEPVDHQVSGQTTATAGNSAAFEYTRALVDGDFFGSMAFTVAPTAVLGAYEASILSIELVAEGALAPRLNIGSMGLDSRVTAGVSVLPTASAGVTIEHTVSGGIIVEPKVTLNVTIESVVAGGVTIEPAGDGEILLEAM